MAMCPVCYDRVTPVKNVSPYLNKDQTDSSRAGDYYCTTCPDNKRGNSGLCYWWEHEVSHEMILEDLQSCQYSVFSGGSPTYETACREAAVRRVSWDGGKSWLYVCSEHSVKVEDAYLEAKERKHTNTNG